MDFFSSEFFANTVGNNDGQLQASMNFAQTIAAELESNTFRTDMRERLDAFFNR